LSRWWSKHGYTPLSPLSLWKKKILNIVKVCLGSSLSWWKQKENLLSCRSIVLGREIQCQSNVSSWTDLFFILHEEKNCTSFLIKKKTKHS
jgi:hypothetical protein